VLDDRLAVPDKDAILVNDYVTPYDWAIVTSLTASALPAGQLPKLRILILSPEQGTAPSQSALRRLSSVSNVMPWVQTYGVLQKDELVLAALPTRHDELSFLRTAAPVRTCGVEYLLNDLNDLTRVRDLASTLDGDNGQSRAALRDVIAVWRTDLASPENRHSVANYLAPAILAASFPAKLKAFVVERIESNSVERLAITRLAKSLDLWPTRQEEAKIPEGGVVQGARHLHLPFFPEKPVFLLLDDQLELGYRDIVTTVLFGEGRTPSKDGSQLQCLKGPLELLDSLSVVKDWMAPRVLRWNGIPLAGLFLDLRLWNREQEAARVIAHILSAAQRVGASGAGDDAMQRALSAAASTVAGKNTQREQLDALALLPLLLSHYDASLPIIVFSSTQQRRVTEALGHRHNIITTFSKPVLAGYDSSGDELGILVEAVRQALSLQPGRHLWNVLENFKLRSGAWKLPLSEADVRKMLAGFIWDYLTAGRSHDFLSVPWEFLEACFFRRPGKTPGYTADSRRRSVVAWAPSHEYLVRSIENFRHRKSHGLGLLGQTNDDLDALRKIAALLAALLLDFLSDCPDVGPDDSAKREQLGDRLAVHISKTVRDLGVVTRASFLDKAWWYRRLSVADARWPLYAACSLYLALHVNSISQSVRAACHVYIEDVIARS